MRNYFSGTDDLEQWGLCSEGKARFDLCRTLLRPTHDHCWIAEPV